MPVIRIVQFSTWGSEDGSPEKIAEFNFGDIGSILSVPCVMGAAILDSMTGRGTDFAIVEIDGREAVNLSGSFPVGAEALVNDKEVVDWCKTVFGHYHKIKNLW